MGISQFLKHQDQNFHQHPVGITVNAMNEFVCSTWRDIPGHPNCSMHCCTNSIVMWWCATEGLQAATFWDFRNTIFLLARTPQHKKSLLPQFWPYILCPAVPKIVLLWCILEHPNVYVRVRRVQIDCPGVGSVSVKWVLSSWHQCQQQLKPYFTFKCGKVQVLTRQPCF